MTPLDQALTLVNDLREAEWRSGMHRTDEKTKQAVDAASALVEFLRAVLPQDEKLKGLTLDESKQVIRDLPRGSLEGLAVSLLIQTRVHERATIDHLNEKMRKELGLDDPGTVRDFQVWLDGYRSHNVSEVFHAIVDKYRIALAAHSRKS